MAPGRADPVEDVPLTLATSARRLRQARNWSTMTSAATSGARDDELRVRVRADSAPAPMSAARRLAVGEVS